MFLIELFSTWYLKNEYYIAAAQLSAAMIGMGASTTINDFLGLIKHPKALSTGLFFQLLILPFLALLWLQFGNFSVGYMIGIAMFCVLPGGSLSNILTFIARGNFALSIGLTAITTFMCLLTLPITLNFLIGEHFPSDFKMPKQKIVIDIVSFLLVPLIGGMVVRRLAPKYHEHITTVFMRIAFSLVAMIVIGAFTSGRLDWSLLFNSSIFYLIAFAISYLAISFIPIFLAKRKDFAAIQLEMISRNTNVGIMLLVSIFPAQGISVTQREMGEQAFAILLFLSGPALLISFGLAFWHRNHNAIE